MKKTLLIIICLFIAFNINAQNDDFYKYVILNPSLPLREKADTLSKVIIQVPFSSQVIMHYNYSVSDTIDGKFCIWRLVDYKEFKGYMLEKYLSTYLYSNSSEINDAYRILTEGDYCAQPINYSPDLYWYGIYSTDSIDVQEMLEIKVKILFQQALNKTEQAKFFATDYMQDWIKISTNLDRKSLFLIGSKTKLNPGFIYGKFIDRPKNFERNPECFLYPEQIKMMQIKNSRNLLYIKAQEKAYIDDSIKMTIQKSYNLALFDIDNEYFQDTSIAQNISQDIPHMSKPASKHCEYLNPQIRWFGDIDKDGKIDLIICSTMMAGTGGADTNWILFLSSPADKKKFVKKTACWTIYGCF